MNGNWVIPRWIWGYSILQWMPQVIAKNFLRILGCPLFCPWQPVLAHHWDPVGIRECFSFWKAKKKSLTFQKSNTACRKIHKNPLYTFSSMSQATDFHLVWGVPSHLWLPEGYSRYIPITPSSFPCSDHPFMLKSPFRYIQIIPMPRSNLGRLLESLSLLQEDCKISHKIHAIYGNIYHQYTPNVSLFTIHGSVMGIGIS